MDWIKYGKQTDLGNNQRRSSISVHRILSGSWFKQSNDYSKNDGNSFGDGHNKHLYAVRRKLCLLLALSATVSAPANAETVGGVSATANPIANSSGSVSYTHLRAHET